MHNASQTKIATLDRQDTRTEENGLATEASYTFGVDVEDLRLVVRDNVRFWGVEVERLMYDDVEA